MPYLLGVLSNTWVGKGVLLAVVATGLLVVIVLAKLVGADATSTSFNPATIELGNIGDSATITIQTVDVDAGTDGVQINVQHTSDVTVTSPACVGIFSGGSVTGPGAVSGGTLFGCFLIGSDVSSTTGDVMTFLLTRAGAGNPLLTFGTQGGFETQFSDSGAGIGPGTTNTLQVASLSCSPPASGDWTITLSCTFEGSAQAPANVIVEDNVELKIMGGSSLNIDFSSHHLRIKTGARVIIKSGGKIH